MNRLTLAASALEQGGGNLPLAQRCTKQAAKENLRMFTDCLLRLTFWQVALVLGSLLIPDHSAQAQSTAPVQVAAVGDIACDPSERDYNKGNGTPEACRMKYTAELVPPRTAAVLVLGDLQYDKGKLKDFRESYEASWGRFKGITYPVPGNHEYATAGAKGYFDYFGARAGDREKGYYSFDLGNWHLVALNSNCTEVKCSPGSAQESWLKADLEKSSKCTIAYWHHPRFSSGKHGSDKSTDALWQVLVEQKVELLLTGHEHSYERFEAMDRQGRKSGNGVVQMVVGTGGKSLYEFKKPLSSSAVRYNKGFGVLLLSLYPDRLDFRFVGEAGSEFSDSGTIYCR
jgi:calcineurin-like phosphoesterase family protein